MQPVGFIFIAAMLNIFSKAPAVVAIFRRSGRYNNRDPRPQFASDGAVQRMYNAHLNTMEAFPVFAAGMLAGWWGELDPVILQSCGWVFIAARICYVAAYVAGMNWGRSAIWATGWIASLVPLAMVGF